MDDKKIKILKMVEDKIITVEEAIKLLQIVENENQEVLEKNEIGKLSLEGKGSGKAESVKQAKIIKISENEYEILPAENRNRGKLKKQGWFGSKFFRSGRKLIIRVEEKGKVVVNLQFPLGIIAPLIKGGIKVGQVNSPEFHRYINRIDPEELNQYIDSSYIGPLIDIHDKEGDEHVYIGIE